MFSKINWQHGNKFPTTHTVENKPSHPSRSSSTALPFAGRQKQKPAGIPRASRHSGAVQQHTRFSPAPDFRSAKMPHSSENTNVCWEGKRWDLQGQDPSPVPEIDRWKTTSWSQQGKCPILQLQGRNLRHFWRSPKGLGKVLGQEEGTQKQAAVSCQGTRRPALARQQQTVSSILHCRELILRQNLVFCECWALTPHHAQRARTGLWPWSQHRNVREDLVSFLPERRKI